MDNNIIPNFIKDNNFGKIGECRLIEILESLPDKKDVVDISSTKLGKTEDIDILYRDKCGKETKFEVKTDRYGTRSGFVAYEISCHGKPGCLARSTADAVFYLFTDKDNNIINQYIIKLSNWRRYIKRFESELLNENKLYGIYFHSNKLDDRGVPIDTSMYLCNINTMIKLGYARIVDIKYSNNGNRQL